MFKILSYNSLTKKQKKEFFNFCKNESYEITQPAYSNMWSEHWENETNSLLYLLEATDRFDSPDGEFNIVYCGNEIAAVGGVYKSNFNNAISLAGTRAWASKPYRNTQIFRNVLLPYHKQWSIKSGCKAVALCFNDYNKNIINTFKRTRLGEKRTVSDREPHHLFYTGLHEVEFPVVIQYTPQWVIYEKLDADWNYDWKEISVS